MKIVSACLVGLPCRYDGSSAPNDYVIELVKKGHAILVCPEKLAGLSTPRDPVEIYKNRIIKKGGTDLTEQYLSGAKKALEIVEYLQCNEAILKSKSPTCGYGKIFDGTFSGKLIDGNGVFAQLLLDYGVKIVSDDKL